MTAIAWFASALALTLVLLTGVVATGLRARRRAHLPLVGCSLLALAATVYFAERLGEHYDLEAAGSITPVHLAFAKATTGLYLLPLATGIATIRNPVFRPWHRRAAFFVLALTLVTAVSGLWMIIAAEPLAR